jgi:hypothetical protein
VGVCALAAKPVNSTTKKELRNLLSMWIAGAT